MLRVATPEREHWKQQAEEYGFEFHTMYGERYWDESAYYRFSLKQIEHDLEDPTEEIHQMCLDVVDCVVNSEHWLTRFQIPEAQWDWIRQSWLNRQPSLYSRIDLAYNGKGPAKLYENNADTPTSVYETGFWQWLWLEDKINLGHVSAHADQFNSLQDQLITQFNAIKKTLNTNDVLHLSCCKDSKEDRGTVQYLSDCAEFADIATRFVFVEDIGINTNNEYTDLDNNEISTLFKLYPWEFMFREDYAQYLSQSSTQFIEPPWKSIVSNKALLPLLWQRFTHHPNLLPAFFEDELHLSEASDTLVKKPLFSREGANVSLIKDHKTLFNSDGPYGDEGFIYQAYHPLPLFDDNFTLIGSWLVNDKAAGISIREDQSPITQDMSRFLPHIID